MFDKKPKVLDNKPRLLSILLSFGFLLLAWASKNYSGPYYRFTNHYLGDLFIVGWLYFLLLFVFPNLKPSSTALIVFLFSVLVEIFQAYLFSIFPGVPSWILFWTGTTFDPWDILAYLAGVALAVIIDWFINSKQESHVVEI
jgi:hypothetical protein